MTPRDNGIIIECWNVVGVTGSLSACGLLAQPGSYPAAAVGLLFRLCDDESGRIVLVEKDVAFEPLIVYALDYGRSVGYLVL